MAQPLSRILAKLRALKPELRESFGVSDIGVFGPYARDEAGVESDLDLLVDFLPDARPTYFSLARLDDRLAQVVGLRVETVPRDGLNPRLAPYINAELVKA
jgi:predicted nucleotidyltransferase